MSCFQRSVQPVHYTLASFRRCFIFGIGIVAFITGIEKLHAQDTLRVTQDSVQVKKSEYLKDSISSFRQKFTLPAVTSPSITIPRLTPSNYKRQGKPIDPANKELGNVTKGQKELFNSTKFNYSSESGFDPSLKNLGENEKSLLKDWKAPGNPLEDLKKTESSRINQQESLSEQKQKEIDKQYKDIQSKTSASSLKKLDEMAVIKSEKLLQKFYDSLKKKDIIPPQPPAFMQKEMSKNDFISEINKEFNEETSAEGDSLKGKKDELKDRAGVQKDRASRLRGRVDSVKNIDLTKYKLSRDEAIQLKPLAGGLMDNKNLKSIDSIRKLNLLEEGYSYKEKLLSQKDKLSQLKQKQTFVQKSYFEGLLGLQQNELTILQLSPALGYNLGKKFSIGAGPSVTLYTNKTAKLLTKASARTFVKAELWKQRVYLQVEDGLQLASKEERKSIDHTVLTGVGGLLPFSKSIALNLMVLYRVYRSDVTVATSPLVFRVGISTIKDKKTRQK